MLLSCVSTYVCENLGLGMYAGHGDVYVYRRVYLYRVSLKKLSVVLRSVYL